MTEKREMLVDVRNTYVNVLCSYKTADSFVFEEAKRAAVNRAKDLVKEYLGVATMMENALTIKMVRAIMDVVTDLSVDVMA